MMDSEKEKKIEVTVLEILSNSNMDETTEYMIRKSDPTSSGWTSPPTRPVGSSSARSSILTSPNKRAKTAAAAEQQNDAKKKKGKNMKIIMKRRREIPMKLSKSRRVTITEFRGRTLVSMREYYRKDGKDLPTSKGISLIAEQWASFSKNAPAIEKAIKKMRSRLN